MYLKCIFIARCLTFCSLFVLYTYYNTLCMCNVFQFTSVMNIKGDNYRKHVFGYIQQLIALNLSSFQPVICQWTCAYLLCLHI
jgi:hypothetical protein